MNLLVLSLCATLAAVEQPPADEEAALLDLLAEETELASRTLQNADYIPGIVSVLHGEDLEALGLRTVLDGLALVPGVETLRDSQGNGTLRVRGIDFFFNSGNVKVLVDSLDVGAESSALNSGVLLMPLSQVERIEVIRGPGSSLHGDFAYTGLVNILTRQQRARVSSLAGEGGLRSFTMAGGHAAGDFSIGANLSALVSDRFDSAGEGPADERRRFANASLRNGGFSLKAAVIDREQLRETLQPGATPNQPPQLRRMRRDEAIETYEARFDHEFAAERRLGIALTRLDADTAENVNSFSGDQSQLAIDGVWRAGRHLLVFEALHAQYTIDRANLMAAQGAPPNQGIAPFSDRRHFRAVMLQDQIELSPRLTLTGGLRYDSLEQVDGRATPRLALVFRADEHHTFKAQYAEGFRTPTFVELFSSGEVNQNLEFEAIKTAELGYLYRHDALSLRATLFNSEVDNLILRRGMGAPGHDNLGFVRSRGIELEWNQSFGEQLKLISTLSLADTTDSRGAAPGQRVKSFGEPALLGNLALLWTPFPDWTVGTHWHHVGDRVNPGDRDFPGYDRVDLALTHRLSAVARLRLGVRNLFDAEVSYVARVPPGRLQINDYAERIGTVELVWDW